MKNMNKLFIGLTSLALLSACGPTTPAHSHEFTMHHDESEHWQVCECGEEQGRAAHEMTDKVTKEPTCTEEGVKTFTCACGYSFTRPIEATGHKFDEGVITTPPTAVDHGVKTYTCTLCGLTKEEAIDPTCSITLDTAEKLPGYSSIYRVDIKAETLTFKTSIPIDTKALDVKVAVKVVDGGTGIFYQPVVGGHEFQWITNTENTGGWANIYDTWYKADGKLSADGSLSLEVRDYEKRAFPVGAKVYVAVEVMPHVIKETPDKIYKDGYKVYGIEVMNETGGFDAKIPFGKAGTEVDAAFTVEGGTTWVAVRAGSIKENKYFRPEWKEGEWWEPYGRWNRYNDTSDAEGNLNVRVEMSDVQLTPGTMIYVAVRERSNKLIHLGQGIVPTQWWINGAYRKTNTNEDFYARESNGIGLDKTHVDPADAASFAEEENVSMEITYDGTRPTIECYWFPGKTPLRGFTKLVFYVMTPDAAAGEISVFMNFNKPKTLVPSLTPNRWTRVVMDLTDPDAVTKEGTSYLAADDLHGFFFGFNVNGKAAEQAKFYVSSVYGF